MKLLIVILGILSLSHLGQQRPTSVDEKELKRQRQHTRAVSLIEQVGSEAALWDDKRSAVEALATAADLLWDVAVANGLIRTHGELIVQDIIGFAFMEDCP